MVSQFMLKKDFLLHGTYLWKTLQILTYVFDWLYSTQCLFPLSITFFILVFYSILSNIDKVLSINPSANVFVFGALETLMFIIRTGLPILVELIHLVNSVIFFLSQMTLPRLSTFLIRFQTVILIALLLQIYLFLLTLIFVLQ